MAAQNATLVLKGLRTGKTYSVDVHAPDASATLLTFNSSGAAASTSNSTYRAVEDCIITDISITTSPTATGFVFSANGNVIPGGVMRWANQLTSLPNRTVLAIPIRSGDFIGGTQFA